jgi:N-acyl-D-amino-acid deacylase
MAQLDVVIRGGTVVDGTGVPRYQADVGIKDGRVARISGRIQGGGAREIDALGCIVAPGAIDLHTHYDAQLNWDPYATLSGWFGVTSVSIGQCGFGFAPTRPEDRDLNMRMMNRIEAIPLKSMQLGMRWDWVTFPEYLDSLDRQGLGVNVGALVPFSPLRGYVLGMRAARERTSVTGAELN